MLEKSAVKSSLQPHYLQRGVFWVCSLFLMAFYLGQSYFGRLNPYPIGILSTLIATLPAFAICILAAAFGRLTFAITLSLVWITLNGVTIANWWHYQYFRSYFNYEALRFGMDSLEGARALSEMAYKKQSIILLSSTFIASTLILVSYHKNFFSKKASLLVAGIALIVSASSWAYYDRFSNNFKQLNVFNLSPHYLHPVHAFFTATDVEASPQDKEHWDQFKKRNEQTNTGSTGLIDPRLSSVLESPKKYNVIYLVFESFRASLIGYYSPEVSVTPNFDKLANKYIVARNFYANTNYTVKSETALWCGVFDHNAKLSIAEYSEPKNITCLPHLLSELGYESFYFHGNMARFYNRKSYLPEVGFHSLYFHADQPQAKKDGLDYIGWGLADEDLIDIMLNKLEKKEKVGENFFASFMSLSSHYPFSFDWPTSQSPENETNNARRTLIENYQDAAQYDDYVIGRFWDRFEKSGLKENTIVVITADHGIWAFDGEESLSEADKNEIFFRMPLILYHPNVDEHLEIVQISSQVDILPTLIDMLPIENALTEGYIGKNIFYQAKQPWSVMMKGGVVYTRVGNKACFFNTDCGGYQQSCLSTEVPEMASDPETSKSCVAIDGDLLSGGKIIGQASVIEGISEIDRAFGMIRFENSKLLQ